MKIENFKLKIMKLLVGLGNPGKEYEKTRHNTGFIFLNKIKEAYEFPDFRFEKKLNAEISISAFPPLPLGEPACPVGKDVRRTAEENTKESRKTILAKPKTFMNNSGRSVKAILDFYKLTPENLIVVHDDVDIEIGKYKISTDSGSAGHNGVEDIISKIGTRNFKRVRVGIANDKLRTHIDTSDFVLQKFSDEELSTLMGDTSGNILHEIEKLM